ncbi:SWIM zinc finger family protein [Falsibacillus albus]|uniref:SWIM zinc finger family protein n=1 Tax=Falsibacillus albus TaxID=2478915 RepID=A0A3L7JWY5_9BACI|nr:SWIM zinc finger family protein [Falsibacillus albus]RLQ94774.1 SWIM zinc finger family protein [Falsibacillus albus]
MPVELEEIKHQVEHYSEQLLDFLDSSKDEMQKTVKKGLNLYRQQLVYQIKPSDSRIDGRVQDVTPVEVTLDLTFPVLNTCSCPQEGMCRHQMAVFFAVFAQFHSVSQWMDRWKSAQALEMIKGLKRGSDLLKQTQLTGYQKWISHYEEAFKSLDTRNLYLIELHAQNTYRNLMRKEPVEREWKPLYQLFTSYFSFKKLNEIALGLEVEDRSDLSHLLSFFQYMLDEAEDAVYRLTVTTMPFAFDEYIEFLKDDTATLIDDQAVFPFETLELYRVMWTSLFKKASWRKQELERLDELNLTTFEEKVALSHHYILSREDDQAMALLKEIGAESMPYVPFWLKWLGGLGQARRYKQLLQFSIDLIPAFFGGFETDYNRISFTRFFLDTIDEGFLEKEDSGFLEKLYLQLLPYSYRYYSEFLLIKKDFKKWMELEQYIGNSIEDLDKSDIKVISTEAPRLLMPMYHETIDRALEERNRQSYKKAVKHLKKLRALYRKEKKMEQWEYFMDSLLDKTKRLRAFHEECRKGKLINA